MPFRDRTGPEGKGPMTGRVSGYCAETDGPENITRQGRGFGRGRRRSRRGWRWGGGFFTAPAAISTEQETYVLESQVKSLQNALRRINDRLDKLKE